MKKKKLTKAKKTSTKNKISDMKILIKEWYYNYIIENKTLFILYFNTNFQKNN